MLKSARLGGWRLFPKTLGKAPFCREMPCSCREKPRLPMDSQGLPGSSSDFQSQGFPRTPRHSQGLPGTGSPKNPRDSLGLPETPWDSQGPSTFTERAVHPGPIPSDETNARNSHVTLPTCCCSQIPHHRTIGGGRQAPCRASY